MKRHADTLLFLLPLLVALLSVFALIDAAAVAPTPAAQGSHWHADMAVAGPAHGPWPL